VALKSCVGDANKSSLNFMETFELLTLGFNIYLLTRASSSTGVAALLWATEAEYQRAGNARHRARYIHGKLQQRKTDRGSGRVEMRQVYIVVLW
jgi:hypothetical protein